MRLFQPEHCLSMFRRFPEREKKSLLKKSSYMSAGLDWNFGEIDRYPVKK